VEISLLKKVPLFSQLDDAELQKMSRHCALQHYTRDQVILVEEEEGNTLFVIHKGRVKVSRIRDDGREVILCILGEGDFFGELSLLDGSPRSATVTTLDDSEILVLRRADFLRLVEEHPQISITLLRELAERIRHSDSQIKSLSLEDAKGRVAATLVMLAEDLGKVKGGQVFIPKLPLQHDLANMAGTARETVSRVLKVLEREGQIRREGRKLSFRNYPEFKRTYG